MSENSKYEEIDLFEMFGAIWKHKVLVIAITLIFAIISVVIALSIPNQYRSQATLMPTKKNEQNSLATLAGSLGGMASFAGLNLNPNTLDESQVALTILTSRKFTREFIVKHGILPEVAATKSWNDSTNTIVFDRELFDQQTNKWLSNEDTDESLKPSHQKAFEKFQENLEFEIDDNGFITISYVHQSPVFSQFVVENLIQDLNMEMKQRDITESKRAIEYLEEQLRNTNIAEIVSVLYRLIEEHTKTLMFANIRDEYAFKTLDPAVIPEIPVSPNRALICIAVTIFGGFIGIIIAISKAAIRKRSNSGK